MGPKFSNRAFLFIIAGLIIFSLNSEIFAQKRVVKRSPQRHSKAIVKLPQNYTRIVVNKRPYYFHHGVFYRKGSHGYAIVRAPLGARIRALPFGYISLRIGGLPFFYYYGTYYRYLPREKVYVVVENPERSGNGNYAADRIYLVDGTTLEGIYLGGTKDTVQFETDGKIQEIPVTEIVSITFAPPEEDSGDD